MLTDAKEYRRAVAGELAEALMGVEQEELDQLVELIVSGRRIFVTGAGQSLLMMRVLAMMLMQSGFTAYVVGDVTTPSLQKGDVLLAASYSGTTPSTSWFVEKARERKGRIGLFTATQDSSMAAGAEVKVIIRCASDGGNGRESVSYDGDGFVQTLMPLAHCVARLAGERIGATEATMVYNHANIE